MSSQYEHHRRVGATPALRKVGTTDPNPLGRAQRQEPFDLKLHALDVAAAGPDPQKKARFERALDEAAKQRRQRK